MLKQKKQENHHLTAAPAVANSQSIGRGRISREGALEVRESRERRDKILAEIKKRPKFRIRNSSFQWGTFIFFAAENPHFFWGGGGVRDHGFTLNQALQVLNHWEWLNTCYR